jgi:hypothetical protein
MSSSCRTAPSRVARCRRISCPILSVGGSTDLALVPSLNALVFLLQSFGFGTTKVLPPLPHDYEQYQCGSRVVVYAAK